MVLMKLVISVSGICRGGALLLCRQQHWLSGIRKWTTKDGKVLVSLTGHDLLTKGFELSLEGIYSGELLEVSVR